MGLRSWVWFGNSTPEERAAEYPCDGYLEVPTRPIVRAITVKASPTLTYRWLCQLAVAGSAASSGRCWLSGMP